MKKQVIIDGVVYVAMAVPAREHSVCVVRCGGGVCAGCDKSRAVEPTVNAIFQVKLHGDNSYREDVFMCTAADDRTVIGEFLTRKNDAWYRGRTAVFQRDRTDFFLNSPAVVRELMKRQ